MEPGDVRKLKRGDGINVLHGSGHQFAVVQEPSITGVSIKVRKYSANSKKFTKTIRWVTNPEIIGRSLLENHIKGGLD